MRKNQDKEHPTSGAAHFTAVTGLACCPFLWLCEAVNRRQPGPWSPGCLTRSGESNLHEHNDFHRSMAILGATGLGTKSGCTSSKEGRCAEKAPHHPTSSLQHMLPTPLYTQLSKLILLGDPAILTQDYKQAFNLHGKRRGERVEGEEGEGGEGYQAIFVGLRSHRT